MSNNSDSKLPIAIACRLDKETAVELTGKIIDHLVQKNQKVMLESRIAQRFQPHLGCELKQMSESLVQMIISIGGDGTILRLCQNLPRKIAAPILGVNLGSVGFLDEVDSDPKSLFDALDHIVKGNYIVERVMRLATLYNRVFLPDALNEVYICSSKPSKVLHVGIKVDKQLVNTAYVDGVIVSTSNGSTAYGLSAGGSLIDPRLRIINIVPVNPFAASGSLKPLVVPGTSEVEIELLRPKLNALIVIDGQTEFRAFPKTSITIRKSDSDAKFVRINRNLSNSYYLRLRTKILKGVKIPEEDAPEE
jgi:NAD+ kinase